VGTLEDVRTRDDGSEVAGISEPDSVDATEARVCKVGLEMPTDDGGTEVGSAESDVAVASFSCKVDS